MLNTNLKWKKKLSNLWSKYLKEYWKILNTNIDKQNCNANLYDLSSFLKNVAMHILWNTNHKTQFYLMKNLINQLMYS